MSLARSLWTVAGANRNLTPDMSDVDRFVRALTRQRFFFWVRKLLGMTFTYLIV